MMADDVEQEMRQYAQKVLVTPFQKLIAATKEPFVQAILDLGVPNMVFERVALVGDAAFILRPHTAASVSKAAQNAIALADALVDADHNVLEALKAWELGQLTLGMQLWRKGQDLGETSQFMYGKERWEG
jgi:2-polyprenyl-6-methoxyphenol hydroxylase-like FAD-dependent oxidoreductase